MKSVITPRLFATVAAVLLSTVAHAPAASAKPAVEVAFVLDTTGSMGALIDGAKRKIWSIATTIADSNPDADISMGLVAYRDIGDEYVTKTFGLTTDIQDLYANLLALKARGGGDWPESVNEALDVAVNKLQWTTGSETRRIVFLVGDAPPHMDYAQDTKYPKTLAVARQNPEGTSVNLPNAVLTIRGTTVLGSCAATCVVALAGSGEANSAAKKPSTITLK